MPTNKKKSIRLKNRTKYFIPGKDRTHVTFSSPDTYESRRIKIEGYESRLYWQFRYCDEHSGATYFYTLTYNDAHMPKYHGVNCFDYEDLRDLLTGGFRKKLLRVYGTKFKYFVGAELGDGKGKRGLANNPHYHILFFLESADNPDYPYNPPTPEEFRHLVRLYWQGFDEDPEYDGFQDYRTARYGIAREGENLGKVTDYRACMYCAKYVCKDAGLKKNEARVRRYLRMKACTEKYPADVCRRFFYERLLPMYTRTRDWTPQELLVHLRPGCFDSPFGDVIYVYGPDGIPRPQQPNDVDLTDYPFEADVPEILRSRPGLWKRYWKFWHECLEDRVRLGINEYRNRYCNKARISHGVGDYALKQPDFDPMNPYIPVPDNKDGMKCRPLSLYYYRKLYTDVKIDHDCPTRYLNDLGISYNLSRLDERLTKKADAAAEQFRLVAGDQQLFEKMRDSDVNLKVFFSYSDFLRDYNYLLNEDNKQIFQCYAEYKLIYQDRYFSVPSDGHPDCGCMPDLNPHDDYARFLVPSCLNRYRSDMWLDAFLASNGAGYLPYLSHPYFLRYARLFDLLDLISDYFFVQKDNRSQKQAEERAAVQRFHSQERVKDFYRKFDFFD